MTPLKAVLALFRKDAGLYGDVQRASQLAWMLFLKAIDERETEREILHDRYRSPIPERCRWRNWTAHTSPDELPFPLPPLPEQRATIARLERVLKICEDLEAQLRTAEGRAAKFAEAVVGELVA